MNPYYGWYIVAISVLALALAIGGTIQAFGLFILPVSEEFRLTRAEMNTAAILFNIGMAVASPVLGRMLDRYSARMVMIASAVTFGASIAVLGLSQQAWLSALVIGVPLAIATVGCGTVTSPTLVARWFTVHRGRALAIAMIGLSLGPVIVVPLVGLLIEAAGWRRALMVMGASIGGLLVLLALLVRERPGPGDVEVRSGVQGDSAAAEAPSDTIAPLAPGRLLRLPQFWTIALSVAFAFGMLQVVMISLVPYAQGQGLSLTDGASLISMYGASAIVGTLLLAWLGDRFNRLALLSVLFALLAATVGSLLLTSSYMAILASVGLFGVIGGMITPAYLALLADRFGAASFGTAAGTASFISTIIGAGCLRISGDMFDLTGSYRLMFLSFLALGLLAAVLLLATAPLSRRHPV